jgi:hypothetical protein
LLLSKEKQEEAEKRAGASLATGVRLGALDEARNLTSTTATPRKTTLKITTKKGKRTTIKERIKTLQRPYLLTFERRTAL